MRRSIALAAALICMPLVAHAGWRVRSQDIQDDDILVCTSAAATKTLIDRFAESSEPAQFMPTLDVALKTRNCGFVAWQENLVRDTVAARERLHPKESRHDIRLLSGQRIALAIKIPGELAHKMKLTQRAKAPQDVWIIELRSRPPGLEV